MIAKNKYRNLDITQENDNYVARKDGKLIAASLDKVDLVTKVDMILDGFHKNPDARKVRNPQHWFIKIGDEFVIYLLSTKVDTATTKEDAIMKVKVLNNKRRDRFDRESLNERERI